MDRRSRATGCLLAGAAGDALGAPVEFLSLAEIRRRYGPAGIRDLDCAYGRVGAITDDTQMTLFTADGLLRAGGAERETVRRAVYHAYLRWYSTQGEDPPADPGPPGWLLGLAELHARRGPGNTCLGALGSGAMGSRERRINHSKGCGGVMRVAPAGLIGTDDPFSLGCDTAAITHSHPAGFLSAGFLALLLHRILRGDPLHAAIDAAAERLAAEPEHEETSAAVHAARAAAQTLAADASAAADGATPEAVERLGGGWVGEEALAIALFCVLAHPTDLEAAVILAANHSGDTDSTAAITGQIMGALLGRDAVPGRWLESLELRSALERVAADLVGGGREAPDWLERYPPE